MLKPITPVIAVFTHKTPRNDEECVDKIAPKANPKRFDFLGTGSVPQPALHHDHKLSHMDH